MTKIQVLFLHGILLHVPTIALNVVSNLLHMCGMMESDIFAKYSCGFQHQRKAHEQNYPVLVYCDSINKCPVAMA